MSIITHISIADIFVEFSDFDTLYLESGKVDGGEQSHGAALAKKYGAGAGNRDVTYHMVTT